MSGNKIDLYVSGPPEIDLSAEQTSSAMMAKDVLALKNRMTDMEQQHKTDITKIQEDKAEKGSTLSEYGIKDAYTKTETDGKISDVKDDIEANYYDKEDIDIKLLQRDDNLQNAIDTYDGRLNGIDDQISEMDSEIADVESIAKGRATGYVFDTLEDLDTWLADETNTANLVLGDNFYIRAVDVPDYWWDGSAKQQLETQKVDLTEYVKNTDYATKEKAGIVKVNNYSQGLAVDNNGQLSIYPAETTDIKLKSAFAKPIGCSNFDYAMSLGTHQTMSDDYDVNSLTVAPYKDGIQSQLPASYEAVKGYVDKTFVPIKSATNERQVYIIERKQDGGAVSTGFLTNYVSANAIVQRGDKGQIPVLSTPIGDSDATSKQYVDTSIQQAILDSWEVAV